MKQKLCRFLLIIYLIFFGIISISCKDKLPVDENNKLILDNINGIHDVYNQDVNSYYMILNRLEDGKLKTSMTIYNHLLPTIGTSRYYQFYQVDWHFSDNQMDRYYHIFENDADKRNYSQNFFPFTELGKQLTSFEVLFKYEYVRNSIRINDSYKYKEEVLSISKKEINEIEDEVNDFDINFIKQNNVDTNIYRLQILFENTLNIGHIDFQSWIVINDEIIPFYGLYHYQLTNDDYDLQKPILEVNKDIEINKIYSKIKYYHDDVIEEYYYLNEVE